MEAILFDVDGTLVDSTAGIELTWREWAARHSIDVDEVLAGCHGRRTTDTVALFVAPADVAAAAAEAEAIAQEHFASAVALPGAAALLYDLRPMRWAVVTSGTRDGVLARLSATGMPAPRVLVAAEDVTAGKPDPECYLKAASLAGADIRRCLVVEDAPAGIQAGRAAGAHTVAVTTTHRADELALADAVVTDLRALWADEGPGGLAVTTR